MELGGIFQPAFLLREFDDSGSVGEHALVVNHGAVDQDRAIPGRLPAIATVDMPEHMEAQLDSEDGTEEVLTPRVFGQDVRFVERAVGRFVG